MAAWTAAAVGRRTACREDGGQRHLRNRAHDAYAAATRAGYRGPAHSAATPEHSGWVCKALPGTGATSGPGGRGLGADTVCRRRLSLRRVAEPRALRTGSTPLSGLGSASPWGLRAAQSSAGPALGVLRLWECRGGAQHPAFCPALCAALPQTSPECAEASALHHYFPGGLSLPLRSWRAQPARKGGGNWERRFAREQGFG